MNRERVHKALTDHGTEIAGRIYGEGPPVVLVHGAMADGELEWAEVLPLLSHRFACYTPSTRGRGLSGMHPDPSREARVRDVTAFVESIGEPVCLAGASGGGMVALGAAARTPAVAAVAVHEPVVLEAIDEDQLARSRKAVSRMSEAAEQGQAAEAARVFFEMIANSDEVAALSEDPDAFEEVAQYLQIDLEEFREAFALDGPSPTEAAALQRISAPVLLTHGSNTALHSWFTAGVRYVAGQVSEPHVREIPGVGHLGHLVEPARLASELVPFFEWASTKSRV